MVWRQIPADVLKARLPEKSNVSPSASAGCYGVTDRSEVQRVIASFIDFVQLCERKERETGTPVTITAMLLTLSILSLAGSLSYNGDFPLLTSMKLLTEAIVKRLPPLVPPITNACRRWRTSSSYPGLETGRGTQPSSIARIFSCLVIGHFKEYGTFSLYELQSVRGPQ